MKARAVLVLTDNIKGNKITPDRLSADLTFVYAGISFLGPFNLEDPLICFTMMVGLETLIARVGVASDSQNVYVPMPDP